MTHRLVLEAMFLCFYSSWCNPKPRCRLGKDLLEFAPSSIFRAPPASDFLAHFLENHNLQLKLLCSKLAALQPLQSLRYMCT